ncbi:unnamed protein product [Didymodactylos carnosus]|uniref:Uncharacterized protein n=1 Tax=Didymodactylos carnosus TaxID=1234261 RepID=A0A815KNF0_9BILA|nr:unnamed protein product [Didymodactylos carnosus]CAF4286647.1 unnamed protein product [Didymodactylos carnosus]
MIQEDDLFIMNEEILLNKIYQCAFMINYKYGYGPNIVYDFDEIELWLRQKLNKCKLIDTETERQFDLFHYQFETFDTKPNLIIKIREYIQQEELPILKREKLKDFITENRDNLLKTLEFSTDINQKITVEEFDREIINNNELIYEPLKSIHIWISTIKRLLLRILSSKQGQLYDTALTEYLCRPELWD